MAYFSNGSEGADYMMQQCDKCVHGEDNQGCPVILLHLLWNYEACKGDQPDASPEEKAKYQALETLWPRDGLDNAQCEMFYAVERE